MAVVGVVVSGHGWVVPLPSGAKARCGGPPMCLVCVMESEGVRITPAVEQLARQRVSFIEHIQAMTKVGDVLMAQAQTWGIEFHVKEGHPELYEDCGNGACASTRKQCQRWRDLVI